jgi:hypothetical protein
VHLNLVEDGVVKSSHKIIGTGGITVTHAIDSENEENVITIHATEAKEYSGSNGQEINVTVEDGVIGASLNETFKADLATKEYVDESLANVDLTNYYNKEEIDGIAEDLTTQNITVLAEA